MSPKLTRTPTLFYHQYLAHQTLTVLHQGAWEFSVSDSQVQELLNLFL